MTGSQDSKKRSAFDPIANIGVGVLLLIFVQIIGLIVYGLGRLVSIFFRGRRYKKYEQGLSNKYQYFCGETGLKYCDVCDRHKNRPLSNNFYKKALYYWRKYWYGVYRLSLVEFVDVMAKPMPKLREIDIMKFLGKYVMVTEALEKMGRSERMVWVTAADVVSKNLDKSVDELVAEVMKGV